MNNAQQTTPRPTGFYSHGTSWNTLIGREPSKFESATGAALWRAFNASQQTPDRFKAVSAATGSGKTKGAIALMAHLFPMRSVIVIREVKECHEAYLDLCALIGEQNVAIIASPGAISKFESEGGSYGHRFTDAEFSSAPVAVCTHARWKGEIEKGTDRGVRLCKGEQRDLIIIDEEPELERVYVAQPEDVSRLASILSDAQLADEARSFGFTEMHHAVPALNAIHGRMRTVKDNLNVAALLPQSDLVTASDALALNSLTRKDVYDRLSHLDHGARTYAADDMERVLEFLKAACEGRVFYSKGAHSQFYAYSYAIPPQRNTIILDGTADLNGLYSVGSSLITVDTPTADYSNVEVNYIGLPKEFSGRTAWDKKNVRRVRTMRPFMDWFKETLLANTKAGEQILVYAPQVLIDTDLHKTDDEATGEAADDDRYCEWEGRKIHWSHFGSGRGTNKFKDCTVYFQIRAHYKPKAAIVAQTLSHTGGMPGTEMMKNWSSGRTKETVYVHVRDTLIACDTKQNAARTCIRKLDDNGTAAKARLYFVSDNLTQIERYQEQMFPQSPKVALIVDPKIDTETSTGPERLAHLLATTDLTLLTYAELMATTGILKQHLGKSLKSPAVRAVMRTQGWRQVKRTEAGLKGNGKVLTLK